MQSLNPLQPHISCRLLTSTSAAFLMVIFMTGLAGALRIPALTVYLHQEVTADPLLVGVFYSVNSLVSMIISQIIAHYSDRYPNRKAIIAISCLMQVLGCLLFAFNRDYYVLLLFGTILFGVGAASSSQLFAFSREYGKSQNRDSAMFNSLLRAHLSLSWIIGPPLAYFLADQFGFTFMYTVAATIFTISILIVVLMLPQGVRSYKKSANANKPLPGEVTISHKRSVIFLSLSFLFLGICNSMMFINMPIYLSEDLGLSNRLAGILMGTAAGIEIPVMLIAGYCTRFISKKTLMFISIMSGASYYIGLSLAHTEWQLLALQLFNGAFIGIAASIGMIYFQDLMPYKMGSATTLFNNTNAASWVAAGPIAGILASEFGYQSTWWVSIIFCLIAFGFILPVRKV